MFEFFYLDLAFFIFRLALGLVFLLKGLDLLLHKKKQIAVLGPRYSWVIFIGAMIKTTSALMLLIGVWVSYAGAILAVITFFVLLFHILVWRDKFLDGWDKALVRFAGALLFALAGGGNWVLLV